MFYRSLSHLAQVHEKPSNSILRRCDENVLALRDAVRNYFVHVVRYGSLHAILVYGKKG
jgi:hypothetical protein